MKKEEKLDITKAKLLKAAEKLMNECTNASEVTSRAIAKEAGVQLAMVNYCFGSREALLYEVFAQKSDAYATDERMKTILCADIPPKEKLRQIHYLVAEFFMSSYKFSKAVTSYVLLHRDLSKGLGSLPLVLAHYNGRRTEQECKIISYELSSIMQLAICRYEELRDFSGYDLSDREQLHKYVDMQIELFLED